MGNDEEPQLQFKIGIWDPSAAMCELVETVVILED
jgi:hypothetical protein